MNTKHCLTCQTPFPILSNTKAQKYCRELCRKSRYQPKPLIGKNCIICNEFFMPNQNAQKYCSSKCYPKFRGYSDFLARGNRMCDFCENPTLYIALKHSYCYQHGIEYLNLDGDKLGIVAVK